MANRLFEKLALFEGFCCSYGYLIAHRLWNTRRIAAHLGLSDRAIRYQKAKKKCGKIACRNAKNCARLQEPVER